MSNAAAFVARKPLTLLGRRYAAHEAVDLQAVSPGLRRRLVEQRRVVPRAQRAAANPAPEVKAPQPAEAVVRCGDLGGKRKNGKPCAWIIRDGRPCPYHSNER